MAEKKNKGASKKKTKPALVKTPAAGQEVKKGTTRSINIGLPVDEETFREMKEKARKL